MDITQHPAFDLSLERLLKEQEMIKKFNARISKKSYKFKNSIKPHYPQYLDDLIDFKETGQLKLDM